MQSREFQLALPAVATLLPSHPSIGLVTRYWFGYKVAVICVRCQKHVAYVATSSKHILGYVCREVHVLGHIMCIRLVWMLC
jgi:hypothetical protein